MAQLRFSAMMLFMASLASIGSCAFILNWNCGSKYTIADLTVCEDALVNMKDAANAAGFPTDFSEACSLMPDVTGCFADPNGVRSCLYVKATNRLTCGCPGEGIQYTQDTVPAGVRLGLNCTNVDECAIDTDNCDPVRATCTDTDGSFVCACKFGFLGDGVTCVPYTNECDVPVDPACDPLAICANVDRSIGCFAKDAGVATSIAADMTALTCIRICHDATMSVASVSQTECFCSNTQPSGSEGTCDFACPDGSGNSCGSIDATQANYYNTGPGHTCTCPAGYNGDGSTCTNINECGVLMVSSGSCTDTQGSYTIVCDRGFYRTADNCLAAKTRACTADGDGMTLGAYEDWSDDCLTVSLFDCAGVNLTPTATYGLSPLTNGVCGSTGFDSTVTSADFTFADFVTNDLGLQVLRSQVVCGSSSMAIIIDRFVANQNGIYLPDMGMGDTPGGNTASFLAACRGTKFYADGAYYRFELSLTSSDCGFTSSQVSSELTAYTMKISGHVGTSSDGISRIRNIDLTATCTYDINNIATSNRFFIYELPSVAKRSVDFELKNPVRIARTISESLLELNAKQDATFSSAYDNQPILWNQMAYIEAALQSNPDDRFSIQWLQCWESPSNLAIDQRRKHILTNGCDIDSEVSKGRVSVYSNAKSTARLGFNPRSFEGGEAETIYVHCLVNVCDNSSKCCSDVCKDRAGDTSSFKVDPTFKLVTSGPIVVKDTCGGSSKGGCEQLCSVTEEGQALCSCVPGFEVDSEDKSACQVVKGGSASSQAAAVQWYYIVLPIFALVLIAVAVAVALKLREKPSSAYKLPELADLADS